MSSEDRDMAMDTLRANFRPHVQRVREENGEIVVTVNPNAGAAVVLPQELRGYAVRREEGKAPEKTPAASSAAPSRETADLRSENARLRDELEAAKRAAAEK